jgi:hypothetical protein
MSIQKHLTNKDLEEIPSSKNQITPPILTVNVDNYSPPGFAYGIIIRQDINSNNRSISGFTAPPAGVAATIAVCNINTSGKDLRFEHNNAGSSAPNRMLLRDAANKSIKPNETAWFWYDHTDSRWRPYNRIG